MPDVSGYISCYSHSVERDEFASEIDRFCDSSVFFALTISEEAATLVLAGQHLLDFVDFDSTSRRLSFSAMPPSPVD